MSLIRSFVFVSTAFFSFCSAWESCSKRLGGGICPDGNTCCSLDNSNRTENLNNTIGCIPSDMGKHYGTCCSKGGGGCPVGYDCRAENEYNERSTYFYCKATPSAPMQDYLTQHLPRYRLCSIDVRLSQLNGFKVPSENNDGSGYLAYFSSHGALENISLTELENIDTVLIVIHGANRNADDYFCSALALAQTQKAHINVLVLAPWFLGDMDHHHGYEKDFLVWNHEDNDGPWRYGADSMNHKISSFTVLDRFVEAIQDLPFGSSRQIDVVLFGHSSGGQMVHRWSFLTHFWKSEAVNMKAIVANPSSFLYLTPLRKMEGEWKVPSIENMNCSAYNSWEWGLDSGGDLKVPYRDRALANASAVSALIEEYQDREVIYLSGSIDVCNSTGSETLHLKNATCHSHGLETTCMDQLQGSNRFERSQIYMESLIHVWSTPDHAHVRIVVRGVGHDHSLMINSPEGTNAIFGSSATNQIMTQVDS